MSLIDKQEVQDICGHTALCTRKWIGFICKQASEDTQYRARSAEERRKKNAKSLFFTSCCAYVNLRYIDIIHSFDWKSAVEHDGGV